MILIDNNLWLSSSFQEVPHHAQAKAWLESTFNGDEAIALPWSVVLAVLRICTQSRLMVKPPQPCPGL